MNAYSFGVENPIKVKITKAQAEAYNRVVDLFAENPDTPIPDLWKQVSEDDLAIHTEVSGLYSQAMIELPSEVVSNASYTDIHLVKN